MAARTKEAIIDFNAGIIGGTACAYVGQPMDTVKVKIQTYPHLYSSAIRCAIDTVKNEGFFKLYAGSVPAVWANVAENSVLFLCYGQCSRLVAHIAGSNKDNMTLLQKAFSGSFAAFFAAFSLCPLELIKCRMQTLTEFGGSSKTVTPTTIIKEVLRRDGPLGFYHGITSTILRDVPGYFFFFGGYEATRYYLTPAGGDTDNIGLLRTIIAGGMGGICIWGVSYPADVVKSRMQVYSAGGKAVGALEVVRMLIKEGGIFAFYRGIAPTLFRSFPANAALFAAYEYSKEFMHSVT